MIQPDATEHRDGASSRTFAREDSGLATVELYLLRKRASIAAHLNDLDELLATLATEYATRRREILNERRSTLEALGHVEGLMRMERIAAPSFETPPSNLVDKGSSLECAIQLLKGKGHEMHYRQIAETLQSLGHEIPGRDPAATLLTRMSRDPRFRRGTGRGSYALSEWPARRKRKPTTRVDRSKARTK